MKNIKSFVLHALLRYIDLYRKTIANSSKYQQKLSKYTKFLELMENHTGIPFKEDIYFIM